MKKHTITLMLAGLALALTGAHAQTLDERIESVLENRKTLDWSSAEIDTLASDILSAGVSAVTDNKAAAVIVQGADINRQFFDNPPATLSPAVEAFWRDVVAAGGYPERFVGTILAAYYDRNLGTLPENHQPEVLLQWGIERGNYTFAELEDYLVGKGAATPKYIQAFKTYRSTLPIAEKITLTANEVNALINVQSRTPAQDQILTELSADLMALKLQQ